MSVSGVLGWQNIKGLSVRIDIPDEVYSGQETLLTVRLRNDKRHFPSFLLKFGTDLGEVEFDILGRSEELRGSFLCRFPERGTYKIVSGELSSPFPINFFVRSRWLAVNRTLVVFPAPLSCSLPPGFGGIVRSGLFASRYKGYEGDVAKINDYSGVEPLKLIHWRLTARHGKLKVKELNAPAQEPVIIDLAAIKPGKLEESLSCAVFLTNRLIRSNRPVGLRIRERLIAPEISRDHRLHLLAELALYGKN